MGAVRKKSILICNIICAVLLLFIVVCQFVPFWSITSPVTDQSSLLGVTGRQYVHEALIESLSTTYGGFTHQDIATQVLVSVVVGAFALFQSLKNMQKSGHGILGVVISLFGLHLWATVPAYNTIALGNLLYYAYVALLFVSFYLVCNYLIAKLTEEDPEEPEKKKNVITAVLLACAFSLAFVVFGSNVKTTIDKKAEDRKVSDISHTRYVAKLEKDIARKDATIEKLEAEAAEPEVTEPEVTEPEVTEPEVTEPEVTEPEATEPEATDPEATEPEVTEPEVTEPEVTEPEVTEPEVTEPEVTEPEVTEPEVTEPEVTEPEPSEPEGDDEELTLTLKEYTVQKGDNLYDICVKSGIDYNKYYRLIVYINNLRDPDSLRVGDVLLLPYIE